MIAQIIIMGSLRILCGAFNVAGRERSPAVTYVACFKWTSRKNTESAKGVLYIASVVT
jgi:hypothetical protein